MDCNEDRDDTSLISILIMKVIQYYQGRALSEVVEGEGYHAVYATQVRGYRYLSQGE